MCFIPVFLPALSMLHVRAGAADAASPGHCDELRGWRRPPRLCAALQAGRGCGTVCIYATPRAVAHQCMLSIHALFQVGRGASLTRQLTGSSCPSARTHTYLASHIRYFFRQIVEGLDYCHHNNIAHRCECSTKTHSRISDCNHQSSPKCSHHHHHPLLLCCCSAAGT